MLAALVAGGSSPALASYAFYVGRNLTADGSVLLGGTGEEVSGHWLEIVPGRSYPAGSTVKVGVTDRARMPGELIEIPQAARTFKYITMNYSDYMGFPAPITNGGLNEHQVAVRDVWSPSRRELVDMTPKVQHGVQYSDEARIALERAHSARAAAALIGALIDRYGEVTYGGNSHLIADPDEGWVVLEFAGGKGLWVAERLGPDDVRVSYPGYIGDIPADYRTNPRFMGSANLISFAVAQGWYDPKAGKPFNVHDVYGSQALPMRAGAKYWTIAQIETELRSQAPLTVEKMIAMVRDPRIADDQAGYGTVAHLRRGIRDELAVLWVAPTGSVTAPFLPWHIGATQVPREYGVHRYLYKDSGSTFLAAGYGDQEASSFAGQTFKRLMYYTCSRPAALLPEVTRTLSAFEARLRREDAVAEATAETLYAAGKPALAAQYLDLFGSTRALDALRLGEGMIAGIEARLRAEDGFQRPPGNTPNMTERFGGIHCLTGHNPDRPEP